MIVTLAPAARVTRVHGKAVVHAPVFETKVSPVGVESVTTTFVAIDGPLLLTVIVNGTLVPAMACSGPVFSTATSAAAVIVLVSVALLFAGAGSGVSAGGVTLAV